MSGVETSTSLTSAGTGAYTAKVGCGFETTEVIGAATGRPQMPVKMVCSTVRYSCPPADSTGKFSRPWSLYNCAGRPVSVGWVTAYSSRVDESVVLTEKTWNVPPASSPVVIGAAATGTGSAAPARTSADAASLAEAGVGAPEGAESGEGAGVLQADSTTAMRIATRIGGR